METNKIYNCDCIQGMGLLEDGSVDFTVTSPPYDNLRTYSKNIDKSWCEDVWKPIISELYRVTKQGGVVVWVVGDATVNGSETGTSFRQALYFLDCGFNLHDTMIYQKHNPTPNTGNGCRYQQSFEYMFVFSKGKPKTVNLILEPRRNTCNDKRTFRLIKRQRNIDGEFDKIQPYYIKENVPKQNIWNYKVGLYNTSSYKDTFKHPAVFPEKLAEDHIVSWSREGDVVLDPFIGSGTTAIACIRKNRQYIGFEINEEYCEIAKNRISNELTNNKQLALEI